MKPRRNSTGKPSLEAENLQGYLLQTGGPPASIKVVRVWGVEVVPGPRAPGIRPPGIQAPGIQAPGSQAPGDRAPAYEPGDRRHLAAANVPGAQIEDLGEDTMMSANNGHPMDIHPGNGHSGNGRPVNRLSNIGSSDIGRPGNRRPDLGQVNGAAEAVKQPDAQIEKARQKFEIAEAYFRRKDFRKAIVMYERVRQMPGLPQQVYRACLFNIGQANIKLRRYATAILYFETYLQSNEISDKNRKWAQGLLEDARRGAGVGA